MTLMSSGAKTIKKNTISTQNKSQTHRAKQYEVTSFLSTDCELSTETCSKNVYSLGPWSTMLYELNCRRIPSLQAVQDVLSSKQHIFGLTLECFRELSFSRLESGVHDKLHISRQIGGIFYFPRHRHQIEGTNGF